MRTTRTLLVLFAVGFLPLAMFMNGCDAINDALQTDVSMTVPIAINAQPSALPSVQNYVVDVSDNKTFADNKSHLKGADLKKVTVKLDTYTGNPTKENALFSSIAYTLRFDSQYGDNTTYTIGSYTNVRAVDFIGTEKEITVTNTDLNNALDKLADRPKFTVYATYTLASGNGNIYTMTGECKLTFNLVAGL